MTEKELDEYALEIAENTLEDHFELEAYLVKCVAETRIDKVPESNIDEQIDDINGYFIQYMKTRKDEDLANMLIHVRQMMSELYHTVDSDSQKILFKKEIDMFTNIVG